MNTINELKTKIIDHGNRYIEKKLEGETLRLELSGLGIPKVKDLDAFVKESNDGINEYRVLTLTLQAGTNDNPFEVKADYCPDFGKVRWNGAYTVHWDSHDGTDIYENHDAKDEKSEEYKIIQMLEVIGFHEHLEKIWGDDCEQFVTEVFLYKWEAIEDDIREAFPGVVSVQGDEYNEGQFTFSTGAVLYGLRYASIRLQIDKHKETRITG